MSATTKESFLPPLWVISLIIVGCLLWLIFQLKELVVLLVVGYFIAYVIDPVLDKLEDKKIPRIIGFFLVLTVLLGLLAVLVLTAIPTLAAEYDKLSSNFSTYLAYGVDRLTPVLIWVYEKLGIQHDTITAHDSISQLLAPLTTYLNMSSINSALTALFGTLLKGYSITLTIINLTLLPFIVFYLALDFNTMHKAALNLVPITKRKRVADLFSEIDLYVSAFVRGQLTVCTILFVLYSIGLSVVGVELWLLLAAIAGFGNMIPYFGFITGIFLSSLMALVTFGDFSHVFLVWGVFAAVQFLEGTVITPRILGESVGLSPLLIILALFAGGQLFGLLGVFLAVPVSAALRVLLKHGYRWALERR